MRGHRLELLEIEAVMKQEAMGSNRDSWDVWELDELENMGNYGSDGGFQKCEVNQE